MKNLFRRAHGATYHLIEIFQKLISSPLWALGTMFVTVGWMLYESVIARHPVEGSFNGWAYTVLAYTLLSLWVENLVKVQQAQLNKIQQQQMDRIEFILRYLQEQNQAMAEILESNADRDKIVHHLISVSNKMAKQMLDLLGQRPNDEA